VLALLAGKLALVPIVLAVVYVVLGWLLLGATRRRVAELSRTRTTRQGLLLETVKRLRGIRCIRVEDSWLERLRAVSADTAVAGYAVTQIANLSHAIAHFLMMIAGLAAVTLGSLEVMTGDLSVGALIASMLLTWRVLAPLQATFLALPRLHQLIDTTRRLNRLMALPTEMVGGQARRLGELRGRVTLAGITHRYGTASEPALISVSCDVQPGDVVAICGPSGAGKTSLLKAIAAMYQPLAGTILFDGIDIRQFDPRELRRSRAYVPQVCQLFRGTIAQNLRLGAPTASADELIEAAAQAGVLDDILAMPEEFDTRIGDQELNRLPLSMQQRLALARAYLKNAPVLLLDEPANSLDADGDRALIDQIKRLRGRSTTFLVTHRPSHMRLADRVLVLEGGRLRFSGTSAEVLAAMPRDFL
jgi:ATP-binding cassette subfamily C protein/ATP-binding cassette subfamily C protein LapB